MAGAVTTRGPHLGTITRAVIVAIAVGLAVTTFRSQTAVDWVIDGRPTWAHLARSLLKWTWVTFVALRAIQETVDWFVPRRTRTRPWGLDSLNRVEVTCAPGLPRFVTDDPMGGVGFCLWFGAILVTIDSFLQMHPTYRPRVRQAFWAVAFVALVPWGLPSVQTRWPSQMT